MGEMMAVNSNAKRIETVAAPKAAAAPKQDLLRALASKGKYEAPKVVSFPIDGMKVSGPITLAGNGGGPPV
jgi:hypothetical protein